MIRTLPISAEQPPDATRTAAGQLVTLAAVQAVAVQTAASLTLAALLWPLIPAARAVADLASALGQRLPLRPLPEQQVVVRPGSSSAGRAATVPGGPPGTVRAAGVITLGVEEEFLLLDPSTGATVLAAPDLVRMLGEPGVRQELMRFQVETATAVCTSLDEAGRELIRLRRLAADAAAHLGCRLVASGVAPYGTPGLDALTPQPRYQELARRYAPVVAQAGTCACHVHVGVPSRDLGVQVLARLRPWLAPLLAVTANSPIADGHDAGWASWRYAIQSRWPTATPPAAWPDAAAYDTAVRRLIGQGAALDERSVYFLARLSPRYPTVEVRVADVCLDAGTAVLLAGLTRALVATALAEARRGRRRQRRRPGRSPRPWPPRPGTGSPGQEPTRSPGSPSMRRRSAPASLIMSTPRSATTATPRRSPGCCAGSMTGGPEPTASEPGSPAVYPRLCSSPHSPARRCPATSRAASGPMPGSRQRQARSRGSERFSTSPRRPPVNDSAGGDLGGIECRRPARPRASERHDVWPVQAGLSTLGAHHRRHAA